MANILRFIDEGWTAMQKELYVQRNFKMAEIHAVISFAKPVISWDSYSGIAECRRSCGGLGYSQYSNFSDMLTAVDVN